ncbi:MAG: carboxypeptidase regulatory-like domain-containing protein [Deltaproteobacteria bacterium]|nr:carboxypeptidase regulatory-like domain-containing protein [Deltaproteobacteria bacterium]
MSAKQKIWIVAATAAIGLGAGCGETGPAGPAGAPAWDLNANGTCDPATEDTNGDGVCDMTDIAPPPGVSCWDLDESGDCDLATEDSNDDGACDVLDCRGGGNGFSCWDLDESGDCDTATEDRNGDDACTTADCYGMPGITCWDLDESGDCDAAAEDINGDGDCTIADCMIPGTACWDADANGACDAATEDVDGDGDCTIVDCVGTSEGTVEGSVTSDAGVAIDGATVAFFPGTATATTDAAGEYTIELPIGVYSATATATGYTDASADNISVVAGGTTTLDAIELVAVNPLTASAGADQRQVGYGATVSLTGTGSGAATLTYSWSQTAGPAATITGGTTATPTITMPTIDAALTAAGDGYALHDRTMLLPIAPRFQGSVTMRLTVSGDGFTKTDDVVITAAEPVGSVLNVGVGMNVFFLAAIGTGTYSWTLTPPSGSAATLRDGATRTPSFIPDVAGSYTMALSGGPSFTVVAGNWEGTASSCSGCHDGSPAPDMMTPFAATNHATAFQRKIDDAAGHFGGNCVSCHSVGYSAAASGNNGFDDVAATAGWTFPSALAAGNWDAMLAAYPAVARLAGIQCENCHGPNDSDAHMAADGSRMSMNAGMCAQCHDSGTHHFRPAEWATSGHGNLELAIEEGVTSTSCVRCHGAQGYLSYSERLAAGNAAPFTSTEVTALGITADNVEPITCQACHDPHDAANPNQLRTYDNVAMLPGGFGVAGVGKGATCMTCHNSRNGVCVPTSTGTAPWCGTTGPAVYWLHDDTTPASRLTSIGGPHRSAQSDVFMGVNAFFVGPGGFDVSPHAAIADTCVGCHMAESEFGEGYGDHTWAPGEELCASCHGEGVDGAAIQATVAARLAGMGPAMAAVVTGDVTDLFTGGATAVNVRAYDEATGCYSHTSSSTSNVSLASAPTSVRKFDAIARALGFCFTMPAAVTWTRVGTGTGGAACSGTVTSTEVCFNAASLKTTTGTAIVPASGVLSKAFWNINLITYDGSGGLHNPVWALDVLKATYEALIAP